MNWQRADEIKVGDRIQVWRGAEPEWEVVTQVRADPQMVLLGTQSPRGFFELTLQRAAQVNVLREA